MRGIKTGIALLVLAVATGCGGSGDDTAASPPPAPSPVTTTAPSASAPAPSAGASDTPSQAPPPVTSTQPSKAQKKQLSKLATCMKKYGIDIPTDPTQTFTPPPGYDPVKAQEALQKCLPTTR